MGVLLTMGLSRIKSKSHEQTVRNILTQWLEESGATVYWGEEVDGYDQETFQVESRGVDRWGDSIHRPDMLVSLGDHTTITEIKPGAKYGTIANGVWETFDYWNKHHTDRLIYTVGEKKYTPDSFTFATRYSPFGHIYPSEHEFFYTNGDMHGVNEHLPQYEANMSAVTLRTMWRFAQSADENISVGVGLLISDLLESVPDFESKTDSFEMVRASEIETPGSPAIFHWRENQDWITV
jgi:hypothetical protein